MGAARSVGVDIEPQAITAASQNAELNRIGPEKLKLLLVPTNDGASSVNEGHEDTDTDLAEVKVLTDKDQFDIVIANILLNPLLELADEIVSHARPGATIGLSGVLREQVPSVIEQYSQFLEDISVSEMEDWACIKGRKKAKYAN